MIEAKLAGAVVVNPTVHSISLGSDISLYDASLSVAKFVACIVAGCRELVKVT